MFVFSSIVKIPVPSCFLFLQEVGGFSPNHLKKYACQIVHHFLNFSGVKMNKYLNPATNLVTVVFLTLDSWAKCLLQLIQPPCLHVSHEKNPGWFGYIGHYTTQVYRDYNKPL